VITTSDTDNTPPLILYDGPEFYEGIDVDFEFEAELIDISGIASADVVYTIDGGTEITLPATGNNGNFYYFTIPFTNYGDQIDFKIVAVDSSPQSNEGETSISSYINGHHLIYDNAQVDFFIPFEAGEGAAVKMNNPAGTDYNLYFALIRNYIDATLSNANMEFHVWDDNNGVPGNDLITPFMVTPEATLENSTLMTRIDLRPFAAQLTDIQDDFYIGFTVPVDIVHCTLTSPGAFNNSLLWDGTNWTQYDGDLHFRSVVELIEGIVPGTIEGSITDTDTGIPIEGAIVTADSYSATTNASGEYSIDVDPGTYTVTCEFGGYETYEQTDVEVNSGEVIVIDIFLQHLYNPPGNLTYHQFTSPNVLLQWQIPVGPGLTNYNVYRNGTLIITVPTTNYFDTNVPPGVYIYYVTAMYGSYESLPSNEVEVTVTGSGTDPENIPFVTNLEGNYPNPFNPTTTIKYSLIENSKVELTIYNLKGQKVKQLIKNQLSTGQHSVVWNGRDENNKQVASGVYFYKLKTENYEKIKKMILIK
jgi:hypothetical protein